MTSAFRFDRTGPTCDGVSLTAIVEREGTPVFVYSAAEIRGRFDELDRAFEGYPHTIHYALKANSSLAVVRLLRELGSAVDANSGGEIELALRAGFAPSEIIFTGVGKRRDELERAVGLGLRAINTESEGELERIASIAEARGTTARVAPRVNPDVDAGSHPHISTGRRFNKFGIAIDRAVEVCAGASRRTGLELVGLHVHIGSQIVDLEPVGAALGALARLADQLKMRGVQLEYLDVGGGLGISYDGTRVPTVAEYARAVVAGVRPSGLPVLLEPGRVVLGPAGVLVTRVLDVKPQPGGRWFVVVDAGMTELMRPALYGAFHRIEAFACAPGPSAPCDVVGPLCETSDVVGVDRMMPVPCVGDLLAVLDVGAYGAVMSSNYNRRPMAPEVLVDGDAWRVVRRRQTVDDLLALEE